MNALCECGLLMTERELKGHFQETGHTKATAQNPSSPILDAAVRQKMTGVLPSIDHPAYYGGDTTYEAIKVIEAWSLNFCLGNAIKYISRAGKKDPACFVEDLEKARWYLDREIANQKAKR